MVSIKRFYNVDKEHLNECAMELQAFAEMRIYITSTCFDS